MQVELLSIAGMLAINTVGTPGIQGAGITGVHGIGVKTPRAAAVAAITVGLAILIHIPKGGMFTNGLLSMMVADGKLLAVTLPVGSTLRTLGATPNVQVSAAPVVTCMAMLIPHPNSTRRPPTLLGSSPVGGLHKGATDLSPFVVRSTIPFGHAIWFGSCMSAGTNLRVWIDDRHPVFRRGVRSILQTDGFSISGEGAAFRPEPLVAETDVLFFEADSWGLQQAMSFAGDDDCRLVALVDDASERFVMDLVEAGVAALVFRHDLNPEKLVTTLRAVGAGNTSFPPDLLPKILERAAQGSNGGSRHLSDRELSVLQLLSEGDNTNDIAEALAYSTRTVKNIVHDVLMKMNCRNRVHAVAQATRQGLI